MAKFLTTVANVSADWRRRAGGRPPSLREAIERLCFIANIEEGVRQSDASKRVTHDDVKELFLS